MRTCAANQAGFNRRVLTRPDSSAGDGTEMRYVWELFTKKNRRSQLEVEEGLRPPPPARTSRVGGRAGDGSVS